MNELKKLIEVEKEDFQSAIEYAETIPAIRDFLNTWGGNCGAPQIVFKGHLVKMLINLEINQDH